MSGIPAGWKKISGVWRIDEATTDDPVLKSIKKGTHYLRNVTAGTIALPSTQAYGTWTFSVYKGADVNNIYIIFISDRSIFILDNSLGYYFLIASNEGIYAGKNLIGSHSNPFNSTIAYTTINTWYDCMITRSITGVITFYIKGGIFIATIGYNGWTLVSTIGGSGTNPSTDTTYTTSQQVIVSIMAGDRITNLKFTDGIVL